MSSIVICYTQKLTKDLSKKFNTEWQTVASNLSYHNIGRRGGNFGEPGREGKEGGKQGEGGKWEPGDLLCLPAKPAGHAKGCSWRESQS